MSKAPSRRTPKAGKAKRLSTSAPIAIFGAFAIAISYAKREIMRVTQATQSVLSRTAPKTSENIKTHFSSWPSSFEVCLNPDWHVHAGRTITAASALQMSSDHVGRNLSGKVCFILRGCPANSQVMSFVVICYHPHPPTTYPAICYAAT